MAAKHKRNPPRSVSIANAATHPKDDIAVPADSPASQAAATEPTGIWRRFQCLLSSPVDGASLAVFRAAVGLIMTLEAFTLLKPSQSSGGAAPLENYYTGSNITFSFQYDGFEWLPLLPPPLILAMVWMLAIAGLTMALGFFYRASAAIVFLTWAYLYAVESTRTYWMSHYYLVLLVTFLMIWMPAARRYSLDARFAGRPPEKVPFWPIFMLRGQLLITYFYAGVAKLNADWLLDAEPVRYFLSQPHVATSSEFVNRILRASEFAYFISFAGAFFDLTVGFLLIVRRTRILGMVLMCLFHATNHFVFFQDIGWFPLLGVTTATIFLAPDWPERLRAWPQRRALAASPRGASEHLQMGRYVAPLVMLWLAWQALFPVRHLLIPGDARFTFEGLPFSWRLKAEVYRSMPCKLRVRDHALFPTAGSGPPTIDWNVWQGQNVIYRQIVPNQIDWSELPEIVLLLEPLLGERILYNPYANSESGNARPLSESLERARELWQEMYGRQPDVYQATVPLSKIVGAFGQALAKRGEARNMDPHSLLSLIITKHGRSGDGQMIPMLRWSYPFELSRRPPDPTPFLVIEDRALIPQAPTEPMRVDRDAWKQGPATLPAGGPGYTHAGAEPLVIYTLEFGIDTADLFPAPSIFDSQSQPDQLPFVAWDYMKELTPSKGMHISTQPFLLRRYARRVADLWQAEYGRRPSVYAATSLSLNGRPLQPVVDPDADLAAVPVRWFGHNPWVLDLEEKRIPREQALPGFLGK